MGGKFSWKRFGISLQSRGNFGVFRDTHQEESSAGLWVGFEGVVAVVSEEKQSQRGGVPSPPREGKKIR